MTYRNVLGIYRMTTHNGPGIRTLIQFKGCPLRCVWCSTPESQKEEPEIGVDPGKCIKCKRCTTCCHTDAVAVENEGIRIHRLRCDNCGRCAEVCFTGALQLLGQAMTADELVEEAKRDEVFFKHSGGGVTLSGGEPLLDPLFTRTLLHALKQEGMTVGVDTCGYVPCEELRSILPYIDFFLWDIKHMDPDAHSKLTGVSNALILRNAITASEYGIPIYLRIPLISGYNDSEKNIRATCEFALGLPSLVEIDLIPLHHFGKARYGSLNRSYPISGELTTTDTTIQNMKELVQSYGLKFNVVT